MQLSPPIRRRGAQPGGARGGEGESLQGGARAAQGPSLSSPSRQGVPWGRVGRQLPGGAEGHVRGSRKAPGAARSQRSCGPSLPLPRRPPPVWSGRTGLRAQKRERPRGEAENLKMRARFEWAHLRLAGGTRACACVLGAGSELEAGCRGRGAYDPRAQQLPFRPALPWSASCPQVAYLGWRPHPGNGDKNCPTCLLRRR